MSRNVAEPGVSLETYALLKKYVDEHGGGGGGDAEKPAYGEITLGTVWAGDTSPYTQAVTAPGGIRVTKKTKVDLIGDSDIRDQMESDGTEAIYIINNNGELTAYAEGAAPSAAMTVFAAFTEVA